MDVAAELGSGCRPRRFGPQAAMRNRSDVETLAALSGESAEGAWSDFLREYSTLIYRVARQFDRDEDRLADLYLYVCEQLHRDDFSRLKKFQRAGPARFSTWLWAVVRNLCLDWRRATLGAPRLFRAIARRAPIEQDVFRCIFHQEMTLDETLGALRASYPELDEALLHEIVDGLHRRLSGRQFWILGSKRREARSLSAVPDGGGPALEETLAADCLDPEVSAGEKESREALAEALSALPEEERLVLRLRFVLDLPLREVARLAELGNPQAAARRIDSALAKVRRDLVARGRGDP